MAPVIAFQTLPRMMGNRTLHARISVRVVERSDTYRPSLLASLKLSWIFSSRRYRDELLHFR